MYIVKEKKVSALKIILIVVGIAAATAAVVTAVMLWKKKKAADKIIEEEIDAAIEAAFAEDEEYETADVKIVESEEV